MSRYIDADAVIEIMEERKRPEVGADASKERYRYIQWLADYQAIKDTPSIDIVRCKECKHASDNNVYGCMCNHFNDNDWDYHRMYADDFCSRGERKESE